jgi:hypothetical protein
VAYSEQFRGIINLQSFEKRAWSKAKEADNMMRTVEKRTIVLSITVFCLWAATTGAAEPVCPQTDYALERDTGMGCEYDDGISFSYTRWGSCAAYFEHYYKQDVEVHRKDRQLWLFSPTHPVLIYVKLNRREYKKKRREYWIAKGREYMREHEKIAVNCTEPDPAISQQNSPIKKDTPKMESTEKVRAAGPTPQSPKQWDDWDALAPKAKSRD